MHRGKTLLTAALAAALTLAAPAAEAAAPTGTARATPPGQVCFWTGQGMVGQSWCYAPPGYAEAPGYIKRNAHSFESKVNGTVYAISFGPGSGCLYRAIYKDDYDENWEAWATKLDGVSTDTMGCEAG